MANKVELAKNSYKTATFFIDESGSKSSAGKYFTIGAIKTYLPGRLSWELRNLKERYNFKDEFKFTKVKNDTLPIYKEAIKIARRTNTLIAAFVLDSRISDQFGNRPTWKVQADLTTQLVKGNIKRKELATVVADVITTPKSISLAETVKNSLNNKLKSLVVVGAMDIDSKASSELQLADLVAGAVNYERKARSGLTGADMDSFTPKSQLVKYIQELYDLESFDDVKKYLVSIKTATVWN